MDMHAPTDIYGLFAHEDDYPDLDAAAAVEHLSRALRCRTVSHVDVSLTDYAEFDRLHELIYASYPHLMAQATVETFGHSLLFTIPGSDEGLAPALLMAHQDVVPVVAGTERDWTHDPFSGHVDEDFVWGRGALDIKEMLIGELEAVEYLLARGARPRRTILLAFGEDEECLQQGAKRIAATLARRGVRLAFLIDEGDYVVTSGNAYGAPGALFKQVQLGEKGYCDVRVMARGAGGHSSRPFGGTSLGHACEAVARIVGAPYPARLSPLTRMTLRALAPHVTRGALAGLLADVDGNADKIAQACLASPELFAQVTTTIAPTMLDGGSQASNVMPHDVRAVVNFRLDPGTSSSDVMARCRELTRDLPVELDWFQDVEEPSPVDAGAGAEDNPGYRAIAGAVARYLHDPTTGAGLPVLPALATGSTDAHSYEGICDACLRMCPMVTTHAESARGVHGTDERITKRAYLQGIRMFIRILEKSCL